MDIQAIKNRFGIIGNSPALNYALQVAAQVANTDLTVLINGESGVGKEVFSQIIHALSARKHNPFIAVNCGAIPEGTIDSELFGHEKGSFTGAVDSRKGYFETVNGGTIFLDEIGEMPLGTQARLLRVLETGEYIRVGSSKVQKTDVRVIAATNRDLLERTQHGKFREDLYYRLNTVPIRVPALRDRKEDIPLLFRKFSVDFSEKYKTPSIQLDEEARQVLVNYPWRGNVRELKNIAEQISVLSSDKQVTANDLKRFLPEIPEVNRLPMLAAPQQQPGSGGDFASERDILYKLFFDMKKDVTEVKKMFFDILQNPNMAHAAEYHHPENHVLHSYPAGNDMPVVPSSGISNAQPIIIADNKIDHHEEVEETLSIADKEKELIVKALKKHKGKRKDAALDLGISERTLYRKLKEYNIAE
ncbi:sigma-54-dependent Fis family transcriptional regulator [Chitinophaga oryzae]|uniref:Sigma-54-dependent Fis family transcriptional regulator n=1 Tax=Chitinophaga oryzae TaxID=2725414 RepID=A0AAE6ZDP7_9BACT|nr:sigma-54 dependent transcriptional regulator [Chitinophaga oryzae]QJB29977.1 sigma-54-dependent Fis family transcriptional regulator [Chitinophaga oryzae]QJB36474.1 sigma-54-dependent Fis family transcriptional regulator [Chitinophaga oryzae]